MAEFRMPSLGADMTQGTLRRWLRKPGDQVKSGDIIAEVETDKGLSDAEVFLDGVIERILVQEGEQVPVGTPLAVIRTAAEEVPSPPPPTAAPPPPASAPPPPAAAPPPSAARPAAPRSGRLRISPLARQRASELRIDLSRLSGSGPEGAITVEDVERAVAPGGATRPPPTSTSTSPPAAPSSPAERMRQVIASAMARSKREIPHYYLRTTVDLGAAMTWLTAANEKRSVNERLLPAVLFVRAVALALKEVPELNAHWDGHAAPPLKDIHVGVAVALRGGGLVAPAIHHTDRLGLDQLMPAMKDVVQRARTGALTTSEMFDGTITLTNLGERGVEEVFPIIYPPQVAIVGVGRIVERPWVVGGRVEARPVATVTLAADHRVSDGHRGALFLAAVESHLLNPESLP